MKIGVVGWTNIDDVKDDGEEIEMNQILKKWMVGLDWMVTDKCGLAAIHNNISTAA